MTRREQVLAAIAAISGRQAADLSPEQDLNVDLGLDSPQLLRLLVELERLLEVELSDEQAQQLRSVGAVLALVERLEGADAVAIGPGQ